MGADAKARSGQQNHFTWREKHLRMNVGKRSQWVRQGSASLEWSAESEWRNLTCVCVFGGEVQWEHIEAGTDVTLRSL